MGDAISRGNLQASPEHMRLLRHWVKQGWEFRKKNNPSFAEDLKKQGFKAYKERLNYELGQIQGKGFDSYFLMLSDAVRWAKDNRIPVGPARGSAAASLVAYLLRITEINPMQFPTMLFARFIDPNRLDLPDVDLDFADDRRDEVRKYLVSKYGADRVGNIGNFTRYRGKNSIDDIARVYRIPKWAAEGVKGLIVERSGGDARQSESLSDTFEMFEKAKEFAEMFPNLRKAELLEGNYRGLGVHAAGIVISNTPIDETCAVYTRPKAGSDEPVSVIAYDKKDSEYLGLLKADFLGLTTMGMIGRALDMIGMELQDLYKIPITEPETLKAFKENNLVGVFQFEGRATTIINRDVSPDNFSHLADINALSRPGPLFSGMTAKYVAVKHGREEPERLHPVVDALTDWTYGQIVYQEQVLSIVKDLAGFPMERVGDIRRIISQKLGQMAMANALEEFIEGCRKTHGIKPELAQKIWNFIATSSTYSFCVTGDTVLERGGAGRHDKSPEITAEQLWRNANDRSPQGVPLSDKIRAGKLTLKAMSDDGRVRPDRLKKITRVGEYRCSKITTITGRSITCSNDHPILTDQGYKTPHELEPGMMAIVDLGKEAREQEKQDLRRSGEGHGWAAGMTWVNGQRMEKDGRTRLFEKAKSRKIEELGEDWNVCQHCGKINDGTKNCLEWAHILPLNEHDGRYETYHHPNNLLRLCNSCHKKFDYRMNGTRKKRWTFGNPTGMEEIASIEDAGVQPVYDLEMEGDQHNYIGNGFVNHNNQSHSVSYAMLGFWTMHLKIHYPKEFYAASLSKIGNGKGDLWKRGRMILDARKNGIPVLPPRLLESGSSWTATEEGILGGFEQVHGIGPKTAESILQFREDSKALGSPLTSWSDLMAVRGIGEKSIEKITEFVASSDPYQVNRTGDILDAARQAISEMDLVQPTHHSTAIPQTGEHEVVWVGLVRNMNYKDYVEATRTRTGREEDDIIATMKDPHLRKSCVLQCYDEGDEDVYVRISRWNFPDVEAELEDIVKDQDVVLVVGRKREDFGISIHTRDMVVLKLSDDEEDESEE